MSTYPSTPELDKQHKAIEDGAHRVGEFLDWLDTQGVELAQRAGFGDDLVPYVRRSRKQLIADFFGIDLDKVEAETMALLDHVRALNEAQKERE